MKDLSSYLKGSIAAAALIAAAGSSALAAESMKIPAGVGGADPDVDAPLEALGPPPIPLDNPQTEAKVELGKMLFFDPRLGGNPSTPCSACHNPDVGWDVEAPISFGYPGTTHWRNSQTIVNSAYYSKLFWAGSSKSLESQAKSAASGAVAGNGEADMMEARLAFIPEYVKRFNEVFGDKWPRIGNAWNAIAAFERTIVQTDTPFDNYLRGDEDALTEEQKRGLELFTGKAQCSECHNGALLSDEKYYNTGVPRYDGWEDDALAQITFRYELYAKGSTEEGYRHTKDDPGFYFRTKEKSDKGKFRTPSLRYTLYTEPYMHNGMLETLEDVVEFYNQGGGENEFSENKSPLIQPLGLTEQEKADLVAFLKSLSGEEILIEEPDLPDYQPLSAVAAEE
ncbi:cytochrome c peroxidase [Ruegeria intermedia]|uniref:Cytochrome c peroxidase n=1 Tax=Ruegeria intermedia TaxID=996115 RepID=A0A1M4ZQS3_9RHOB|nr:cytochrome c peroxidase [Ruegeria intermedia]SHF20147.1 cytochrome c peroxidase [Ruegeria intermedia]